MPSATPQLLKAAGRRADRLAQFGQKPTANGRAPTTMDMVMAPVHALGKGVAILVKTEQKLSAAAQKVLPFVPPSPAARIHDLAVSLPHAHAVPPMPLPLPTGGPVLLLPVVSGAKKTLINGAPAARCGDLGVSILCGFAPMFEILTGSSNVWIEGSRAARQGLDLTRHCLFSIPIGVPLGMLVEGSGNVIIGGTPMPSLTNMAIAQGLRASFQGLSKAIRLFEDPLKRAIRVGKEVYAKSEALQRLRKIHEIKDPTLKAAKLQEFTDWLRKNKGINTVITDEAGLRKLGAGHGNDATLRGNTIHMGENAWRNPDKATNEMIHEVGAKELSDKYGGKNKIPNVGETPIGQTHVLDGVTKGQVK
jgi:uncharacterized Zn-binding protein involved in type VI secretion